MDVWPPERDQRQKRSFAEMSTGATLSPSPAAFRDSPSSFLSSSHFRSAPLNNSYLDRRRSSHPHNQPLQRPPEEMTDRFQPRPRFENQASVIDLTDETEERPVSSRYRDTSRSHRPPQLGRSDAVGFGDFIDLTDDVEPDLIITGGRELPRPDLRRNAPGIQRREASPSLFVPHHPIHRVFPTGPAQEVTRAAAVGVMFGAGGRPAVRLHNFAPVELGNIASMNDFMEHFHAFTHDHAPQVMPGRMDYGHHAFAQRKAEHVAPPPAREDFTRSPKDGDVVICPSCEEELVHKKDGEDLITKKSGKAPSRKEREEHPFWVVKECGHVYCNICFQTRSPSSRQPSTASFKEIAKSGKGKSQKLLACAVEGCESDVKSKDKWVGVFL